MDYLLGGAANKVLDKKLLKRMEGIEALPPEEKEKVHHFIDMAITYNKTKKHIQDKHKARVDRAGFMFIPTVRSIEIAIAIRIIHVIYNFLALL